MVHTWLAETPEHAMPSRVVHIRQARAVIKTTPAGNAKARRGDIHSTHRSTHRTDPM